LYIIILIVQQNYFSDLSAKILDLSAKPFSVYILYNFYNIIFFYSIVTNATRDTTILHIGK